jgi:Uma2 family endonuclease
MATADTTHLDDDDTLVNGIRRPTGPMTEDEFVAWCDEDVKAEWVDGEVIIMSPASLKHVVIANWLIRVMGDFVEDRDLGLILGTEFMVRFGRQRRRRVPDILFIAKERLGLLRENHFEGAPDLAMEIISPDSRERDRRDKFADYQKAGVCEYWIIDPDEEELTAYALGANRRYTAIPPDAGRIPSAVIPGFFLRPEWLWRSPLPRKADALRAMRRRGR